jgi:hypothetical protein
MGEQMIRAVLRLMIQKLQLISIQNKKESINDVASEWLWQWTRFVPKLIHCSAALLFQHVRLLILSLHTLSPASLDHLSSNLINRIVSDLTILLDILSMLLVICVCERFVSITRFLFLIVCLFFSLFCI